MKVGDKVRNTSSMIPDRTGTVITVSTGDRCMVEVSWHWYPPNYVEYESWYFEEELEVLE